MGRLPNASAPWPRTSRRVFSGCGLASALEEVGAVALDLGSCPLDVGAATLDLGKSLFASCAPIAGRLLVSQGRLLMTRRRLPVPQHPVAGRAGLSHAPDVPTLADGHSGSPAYLR